MASSTAPPLQPLWDGALAVLRANDLGGWTKPGPSLYPHIWSWDSACVALGLAPADPNRALLELETLFAAQWADGRVPHIVYNPAAPPDAYFPDAARWACAEVSPAPPRAPATSGLCQPPVHAIALERIWEVVSEQGDPDGRLLHRIRSLYPRVLAWHRYLATQRDPDGIGLVTIYHPWESGTDNSPRWDEPLAAVVGGEVPPYTRRDLAHVADPSHRPTDAEYDLYLWLVESLKRARYDDAAAHRDHLFLVKDVVFSAICSEANEALARLGVALGAPVAEREQLVRWADRFSEGVIAQWDPEEQLAFDLDARSGRPVRVVTWAGLVPLLARGLPADVAGAIVARLFGPRFAGAHGLVVAAVPSTAPDSAGFDPRSYWRGPIWPMANWLLCRGLAKQGRFDEATRLRAAMLELIARPTSRFAEYFQPFTGDPLGSLDHSWTAALALDWLAQTPRRLS